MDVETFEAADGAPEPHTKPVISDGTDEPLHVPVVAVGIVPLDAQAPRAIRPLDQVCLQNHLLLPVRIAPLLENLFEDDDTIAVLTSPLRYGMTVLLNEMAHHQTRRG
jgi:hypothetical protein